jgi:hypothetical protein
VKKVQPDWSTLLLTALLVGMTVKLGAADSSTTVTATPATGVYNVRDYGAVGDGKADDLPAILKALAAMRAAGGGSLYFPAGIYPISDRIEFPGEPSGARVYGDGDSSILRADTGGLSDGNGGTTPGHDMLYLRDLQGVTVDHLRFEGSHVFNKHTNEGSAILLNNTANVQVHSCSFYGAGFGLQEAPLTRGTLFTNNQVLDWGRVGYFVEGHCQVLDNLFQSTDPGPDYDEFVSSHGMYIHSNAQEVTIKGNTYRGIRYYGIQIYGKDYNSTTKDILIQGNTFENNASDVYEYSETNTVVYDNLQVIGNTFRNTRGPSVYLGKGTNLEISDNRFVDVGTNQGTNAIHIGSWDSGSSVIGGKVLRNTILQTKPYSLTGIDVGTVLTQNIELRDNWIEMAGRTGIHTGRVTNLLIANNVIWMAPGNGDSDWAWAMQIDEYSLNAQLTGNEVYGTGTGHARGVESLTNPSLVSGAVANNLFVGAPLPDAGALTLSGNTVQSVTGQPVTSFTLEDAISAAADKTGAKTVSVNIGGGDDATAWLLSETQVHVPAVDDPAWQTTKPTSFTLSDGNEVKRVMLWRKLADDSVSNRPEMATIELAQGG